MSREQQSGPSVFLMNALKRSVLHVHPPKDLPRAVNQEENKNAMQWTDFLSHGVNSSPPLEGRWPRLGYSASPIPFLSTALGTQEGV